MSANPLDQRDTIQPLSTNETLLAVLPFVMFGVASLVSKLNLFHTGPPLLPFWLTLLVSPFLVFNWLVLLGLGAGILMGFPRWTTSYLAWALLTAWWWTNMSTYGYSWRGEIWLPFAATILIALALKRSWQPLKAMAKGLWEDWTLLSLAVYILYSSVFMLYDENHHPYLLWFIAASTVMINLGAWGYFHQAGPLRRILALISGLFGATILSIISEATWDYRAYYDLPESGQKINALGLIALVLLAGLMLGNGYLARWRQSRKTRLNNP